MLQKKNQTAKKIIGIFKMNVEYLQENGFFKAIFTSFVQKDFG